MLTSTPDGALTPASITMQPTVNTVTTQPRHAKPLALTSTHLLMLRPPGGSASMCALGVVGLFIIGITRLGFV